LTLARWMMEIFKTKIAITSEKVAEEYNRLEELGIKTSIEDNEIKWIDVWIRFDKIEYVEKSQYREDEFILSLSSGETLTTKDNPFENL